MVPGYPQARASQGACTHDWESPTYFLVLPPLWESGLAAPHLNYVAGCTDPLLFPFERTQQSTLLTNRGSSAAPCLRRSEVRSTSYVRVLSNSKIFESLWDFQTCLLFCRGSKESTINCTKLWYRLLTDFDPAAPARSLLTSAYQKSLVHENWVRHTELFHCEKCSDWAKQTNMYGKGIMKKDYTGKINTCRVGKLQSKRRLAHHDTAAANEGGEG